jgi:hypothetical protein
MKHILYLQENNLVAIMSGANNISISELKKQVPVGLPSIIVDSEQLPSSVHLEHFRDALTADFDSPGQPNVKIDLEKAKNVAKNKIRDYRTKLYESNDIVIRDAMITNDQVTLKAATKERDRLRNLTKIVDNVSNIDEILDKLKNLNIKV